MSKLSSLYLLIVLVFGSSVALAQQASFGVSYGTALEEGQHANLWSADIRYQLSSKSAFHLEVAQGNYGGETVTTVQETNIFTNTVKTTTTTRDDKFTSAALVYSYNVVSTGGFNMELQVGAGAYKNTVKKYFGLLKGGVFLSAQLSKHIVAGIPVSYQFVTWQRDYYVTTGATLRYHF